MNKYEKPNVIENDDLYEGVYAASGADTNSSHCESKYMNGVYQKGNYTTGSTIKDYFGCSGCAADWSRCAINDPNFTYSANKGDCAPDWELGTGGFRKGHTASDIYNGGQDN